MSINFFFFVQAPKNPFHVIRLPGKQHSPRLFIASKVRGRKNLVLKSWISGDIVLLKFAPQKNRLAGKIMLTKKEKLLIRPWQMQRYYNHRIKVETAGPAIDFHPPPERAHITQKLKKLQKERERKEKIERDNIRLLQRLGAIMSKKRLDNIWTQARPK